VRHTTPPFCRKDLGMTYELMAGSAQGFSTLGFGCSVSNSYWYNLLQCPFYNGFKYLVVGGVALYVSGLVLLIVAVQIDRIIQKIRR